MTELKTDKKNLEDNLASVLGKCNTTRKMLATENSLVIRSKLNRLLKRRTYAAERIETALHAHTLQANIDKVLAMKPEPHLPDKSDTGAFFVVAENKRINERNDKLKEIQAILLGGEK